jgi:hypothetical protein
MLWRGNEAEMKGAGLTGNAKSKFARVIIKKTLQKGALA